MNAITQYRMFLAALVSLRLAAPTGAVPPQVTLAQALHFRRVFLDSVVPDLEGPIGEKVADELARYTAENVTQLQKSMTPAYDFAKGRAGAFASLMATTLMSPEQFVITAASGRQLQAIAAVQVALDYYVMQRHIDNLLNDAAGDPAARFNVSNPTPGHRFDGLRLTASELQARRFEIFHHGSKSEVVRG